MHDLFSSFWDKIQPLTFLSQEIVAAMYVDKNFQHLAFCFLGSGSKESCGVHPRDIFRIAVQLNAFGVVLAHTHPSGELSPSYEDIIATRSLEAAGRELRIPFLGHLIMTPEGWHVIDDSS